ncbi:Retrovirus-related Pol polyprotein from transposon TNT 1-94 [Cucumis melo var. makuwa]|uniref:Retrovirus-related Pol polyprotein from transposon TNT 1-94 n=1 Tax=Cucumis melo var. makuwa TaxID=1194695 RepID=A0A5A7VBY2_CUCMM|nr:Retrovirus-related Pol polyprotein from transposon TNT 1-94 [Cucumis melo var. makuwa]
MLTMLQTLIKEESEYISLGEAVKEAVWLKRIVGELLSQEFIPIIHCDSQSAIHLAKNPSHHERSKHIDVKFHYIRNVIAQKDVELVKVHTVENLSDMLTKALSAHRTPAACGVTFPTTGRFFHSERRRRLFSGNVEGFSGGLRRRVFGICFVSASVLSGSFSDNRSVLSGSFSDNRSVFFGFIPVDSVGFLGLFRRAASVLQAVVNGQCCLSGVQYSGSLILG